MTPAEALAWAIPIGAVTGPLLYGLLGQAAKGLRWVWGGEWA